MLFSDFDFDLPSDRIAVSPVFPRDCAKLLHVLPSGFHDREVRDLPSLLRRGDILVTNDTRVVPARIYGFRGNMAVEAMLDRPLSGNGTVWQAMIRPAKRLRIGDVVEFGEDFSAVMTEKFADGTVALDFGLPPSAVMQKLRRHGEIPLPPYIPRPNGPSASDASDYQTIYAARDGAVAAPTAGLHFTPELLARLYDAGITRTTVTLHVGMGTFMPIRAENPLDHVMHRERGEITAEAATAINAAKRDGGRVVAVGTTSLRLLETASEDDGTITPFSGETGIFIYPGYRFKAADVLMTNFHLPKSTLFMLVAAFAGLKRMKSAYSHAIERGYRFYSYGDATLLEKISDDT